MGKTLAELRLDSHDETQATFTATYDGTGGTNPYELWVTMQGLDAAGEVCAISHAGLRWNESQDVNKGDECQATLPKALDVVTASYEAFVTEYPDVWEPVSNTVAF